MAAEDLTTLAALKQHIGVVSSNEEPELARIITAASVFLVTALSRPIKAASYILDTNGSGGNRLYLPVFPVISVSSVTIDGRTIPAATVGGTDVGYLRDGYCLVLRGYAFTRGIMNVHVAYRAGYEDGAIPKDVEDAVLSLAAAKVRKRDRKDQGLASRSLGPESLSFTNDDMPPEVKTFVDQWKRVTV